MIETDVNVESGRKSFSKSENVINEIIDTENIFCKDLESIITIYDEFFSSFNSKHIFSLLKVCLVELIKFSKSLHEYFVQNKTNPYLICNIFLERCEEFAKYYGNYCELFPLVNAILESMNKTSEISCLIEKCRAQSTHILPISSYLLKPIQRVLKYSLLLQTLESDKLLDPSLHETVQKSIAKMKHVADTINEKQRFQDGYAQLPILRKKIINLTEPLPIAIVGPVLLQEKLMVNNKQKQVILFENVAMIAHINENEQFLIKDALTRDDLVMIEKNDKDSLMFKIYSQKRPKNYYNIKARSSANKQEWVFYIKRLILKDFDVKIDKKKLSGLLGKETANKMLNMNSVDLKNIEEILRSLDTADSLKEEPVTSKMGSKMGINNIGTKSKKFNLNNIIAASKTLSNMMKNEVSEETKVQEEELETNKNEIEALNKSKAIQTVADVIEVINKNKEPGASHISFPWNKDLIDDAARKIINVMGEDTDKLSTKTDDIMFEVKSDSECMNQEKHETDLASSQNDDTWSVMSDTISSKSPTSTSTSSDLIGSDTQAPTQTRLSMRHHAKKRSEGKIKAYSSIEFNRVEGESGAIELLTPVVEKKKNCLSENDFKSQMSLDSSSIQSSNFDVSDESRKSFESSDHPKIELPSDKPPQPKLNEIPKNIVNSIVGVIQTNYNPTSTKQECDVSNTISINKAGRIGNILLKLQQDYMESQERFKCKAEPIKIGKKGIPLNELLKKDARNDQTSNIETTEDKHTNQNTPKQQTDQRCD